MNREINFRKSYLSSLGLNAEQINSQQYFEDCLKHYPIELSKLRKLITKFEIPTKWRSLTWQILLQIRSSNYKEASDFGSTLKEEQYEEFVHVSKILQQGIEETLNINLDINNPIHRLCSVYYTQQLYCVETTIHIEREQIDFQNLLQIAKVFTFVIKEESYAFWCFNNFLIRPHKSISHEHIGINFQIKIVSKLLEIKEPKLIQHFQINKLTLSELCRKWFETYFACCFSIESIVKLWDKLIGMSPNFIAFFTVMLLLSFKNEILNTHGAKEIKDLLYNNASEIIVDSIIYKAIDLVVEYQAQKKLKTSTEIEIPNT